VAQYPSSEEIKTAISEVFSESIGRDPEHLLGSFVPHYFEPMRWICVVPEYEVQELCDFVNLYKTLDNVAQGSAQAMTRFRLPIYCHIMEADFLPTVLWNLLGAIEGEAPRWPMTRTTRKGITEECVYPTQKFDELIERCGRVRLGLGDVLRELWVPHLRNAFSHSQYLVNTDGSVTRTRELATIGSVSTPTRYSEGEIDALYSGALQYLGSFLNHFKATIAQFKDDTPHRIPTGPIQWDPERGWWHAI